MKIAEHNEGAMTVLRPDGPILGEDAAEFRAVFARAAAASSYRVGIDCERITHLDSDGLEALVTAAEQSIDFGRALALIAAGETIRETLVITESDALFQHFADSNAAVRSFL